MRGVLLNWKSRDEVSISQNDSHPFKFRVFATCTFGATKVPDRLVEGSFENRSAIFHSAFGSFGMSFRAFISVVDCDKKRRHVAVEDAVATGAIGLVLQVFGDMVKAVSFFASGGVDQTGRGFVSISADRFQNAVFCIVRNRIWLIKKVG